MSRRESRASLGLRQTDALSEFENFKKKFLLANKHITKLNSTLSAKIEELNAQISVLHVDNLRLRASEIALTSQLKKERQKSQRIMADAESAVANLTKHFGFLRQSLNIPHPHPTPPPSSPARPRARKRPTPDPTAVRLARAPDVPGIYEEDEDGCRSDPPVSPTPAPRKKAHRRTESHPVLPSSSSRLPLPTRIVSPPPIAIQSSASYDSAEAGPIALDLEEQLARRRSRGPARRQSGLLVKVPSSASSSSTATERPPSPAFGSPVRREVRLAEQADEEAAAYIPIEALESEIEEVEIVPRREREKEKEGTKKRSKSKPREKKRRDEDEEYMPTPDVPSAKKEKSRFADVTNSSRGRAAREPKLERLPVLDLAREGTPPVDDLRMTPSPAPMEESAYPTPESREDEDDGRVRRARKAVSYAEPKLNTKMRKPPGSTEGTATKRKREKPNSQGSDGSERPPNSQGSEEDGSRRRKVRSPEAEEEEGAEADAEVGFGLRAGWTGTAGSRRRSAQVAAARVSGMMLIEGAEERRHSMVV